VALFRVLQEALTNVVRHARAHRVEVVLRHSGDGLELRVADDGIGIGTADPSDPHALGLAGMRERVLALGGSFRIGPAPAGGTEVHARVPAGGAAPPRAGSASP
jgi:signal transduction histidine kinase